MIVPATTVITDPGGAMFSTLPPGVPPRPNLRADPVQPALQLECEEQPRELRLAVGGRHLVRLSFPVEVTYLKRGGLVRIGGDADDPLRDVGHLHERECEVSRSAARTYEIARTEQALPDDHGPVVEQEPRSSVSHQEFAHTLGLPASAGYARR
jgi:hypothetical protein